MDSQFSIHSFGSLRLSSQMSKLRQMMTQIIGQTIGIPVLNKGMSGFTSNPLLIPKQDQLSCLEKRLSKRGNAPKKGQVEYYRQSDGYMI